jgi:SagB-type dehydrogenase family enzyme
MNLDDYFFKKTSIKQEYNPYFSIEDKYPKEWLDIHYKFYPRFNKIPLERFREKSNIEDIIIKRRSFRNYKKEYKISMKELSRILFFLNHLKNKDGDSINSRRSYPSAGARYPLEIYLVILNSKDIEKGLYHYNVYSHSLELIMLEDSSAFFKDICNSDWIGKASCLFIFTCIPQRTMIKYFNRGLRYILFEVGHLAQNLMLLSESLGLKTCAIGGFDDNRLAKYLRCEKTNEKPLYIITLGR